MIASLYILLPPLFIISGYTEMKARRIPNWLTLSVLICAVIGSFIIGSSDAGKASLFGALVGGGIFLPFCLMGAVGGGDFKLIAAVGAVVGYPLILWVLYYTVLSGGVLALIYAIWSGQLLKMLTNVSKIILGKKQERREGLKKEVTLPYGIAIAAGTIWALAMHSFY